MKSEFIYQPKTVKLAKELELNPDEMAVIDLIAAGWDKDEAFKLVYRVGFAWDKAALNSEVKKILEKEGAKKRRRKTKKALDKETVEDAEMSQPVAEMNFMDKVSKENTLRELVRAKEKMELGSKEWLETTKMIADINRLKQDEVKTEDTTVHFYLPLQCHQCSLYKANNARK